MLSKRNPHQYKNKSSVGKALHKVTIVANAVYLSHDAMHKKCDSHRKRRLFDFGELKKIKSWKQFISSKSAPMMVLFGVVAAILLMIGIYESYRLYLRSYWIDLGGEDPMDQYRADFYDRRLMIEVEQMLMKAANLDRAGDVVTYRRFLDSTIQKYCLDDLKERGLYLDELGEENFHLNLRRSVHFVASGGELEEHQMLALSPIGSIIDPLNEEVNPQNIAKPCPLLTGLWRMGAPFSGKERRNKGHSPSDSVHAFDHKVKQYHVDEFYDLATAYLLNGDCNHMAMTMPRDILKGFMLSWIDMIHQSAEDTERMRAKNGNGAQRQARPLRQYVIDKVDGRIYESSHQQSDADDYYFCWGVQSALNSAWSYDDDKDQQYSFDSIRDHIDGHFLKWYAEEVIPRNIAFNRA